MLEPAAVGSATPRAFLRIGGISVARQQLALALKMECQRVICLAGGLGPDLIDLQHAAEAAGAQFHVVSGARPLLGLITANDDVIVLGDGLFVSISDAANLLDQGQAVLVQPIDQGLAAGFERIDLNTAAAGAMRLPGRLIERMAELPVDCDVASSLQRIALQAGIRQRSIPAPGQNGTVWTLVRDEKDAHTLEPQWIRQRTREDGPLGPSRALGLLVVRAIGPALLHAGSGSRSIAAASAVLAILALGAGWFGFAALGLAFCLIGWVIHQAADLLARVERDHASSLTAIAFGWVYDGLFVILGAWGSRPELLQTLVDRYFPPLMLLTSLRLAERAIGGRISVWLGDRALLALGLGAVIMADAGNLAIPLGAAAVAMAGILLPGAVKRIT